MGELDGGRFSRWSVREDVLPSVRMLLALGRWQTIAVSLPLTAAPEPIAFQIQQAIGDGLLDGAALASVVALVDLATLGEDLLGERAIAFGGYDRRSRRGRHRPGRVRRRRRHRRRRLPHRTHTPRPPGSRPPANCTSAGTPSWPPTSSTPGTTPRPPNAGSTHARSGRRSPATSTVGRRWSSKPTSPCILSVCCSTSRRSARDGAAPAGTSGWRRGPTSPASGTAAAASSPSVRSVHGATASPAPGSSSPAATRPTAAGSPTPSPGPHHPRGPVHTSARHLGDDGFTPWLGPVENQVRSS